MARADQLIQSGTGVGSTLILTHKNTIEGQVDPRTRGKPQWGTLWRDILQNN